MSSDPVIRILVAVLAVVVLACVQFNAIAYVGAFRHRRRHPASGPFDAEEHPPAAARPLAALRCFIAECAATAVLVLSAPLALWRPRVRPFDGGHHPVILLHGYAQHSANFVWLARALRRDEWQHVYSVSHVPVWGDIERSAARFGRAVDRIRRESGAAAVDVVAHSMGGLVARACIRARPECGIVRLVTLGTPHQGTAAFGRLAHDPMLAQMRPGSALLQILAAADPVPNRVECTSIYSRDDAIVVPSTNGYYPGAFNIEIGGLGHMSMLFSRRVYELVRENLAVEAPAGATLAI